MATRRIHAVSFASEVMSLFLTICARQRNAACCLLLLLLLLTQF
jgi:hypothetical protein